MCPYVEAVSHSASSLNGTTVACSEPIDDNNEMLQYVRFRESSLEQSFDNLQPGHEYNISISVWVENTRGGETFIITNTSKYLSE